MNVSFTGPNGSDAMQFTLNLIAEIKPRVSEALALGTAAREWIREGAAAGLDVDGNAFTAYSERYGVVKRRAVGHSNVDLRGFRSDVHMLDSMVVRAGGSELAQGVPVMDKFTADSFSIDIDDPQIEIRARVHNEGGVHAPQRRWFGVSNQRVGELETMGGKMIEERLAAFIQAARA